MNRRTFLASLLGIAAGSALKSMPLHAEELPALPVPKHVPIPLTNHLQVSMCTGKSEDMWMGRVDCDKWVITEDGILVNQDPIVFYPKFFRGEQIVDGFMVNDARRVWLTARGPSLLPLKYSFNDVVVVPSETVRICPEPLEAGPQSFQEALHYYPQPAQCTCFGNREARSMCPLHGWRQLEN